MSPAETSPLPDTSRRSFPGRSTSDLSLIPFTFRRNSEASSFTWGIVAYSCSTPSILTHVTAVPMRELYSTLRRGLPRVVP